MVSALERIQTVRGIGSMQEGMAVFNGMVKRGIIEKVDIQVKPLRRRGGNHVITWEEHFIQREQPMQRL